MLKQELHEFLLNHGFKYKRNATPGFHVTWWNHVYDNDKLSIYYDDINIFARNLKQDKAFPLHTEYIANLTIDILRQTLINAGIEIKDQFRNIMKKVEYIGNSRQFTKKLFGGLKGKIKLNTGWEEPDIEIKETMKTQQITEENFIETLKYNEFEEELFIFAKEYVKNSHTIHTGDDYRLAVDEKNIIITPDFEEFLAFVLKRIDLKPLPAEQTLWDWALQNGWKIYKDFNGNEELTFKNLFLGRIHIRTDEYIFIFFFGGGAHEMDKNLQLEAQIKVRNS